MKDKWLLGCLTILLVHGAPLSHVRADEKPAASTKKPQQSKEATKTGSGSEAMSEARSEPPLPEPLPGQLSSKYRLDHRNPEDSVPTPAQRDSDPLEYGYFLQDLLFQAEEARKALDFQGVVKYYRAIAKAVPENAKGWSKLCEAYQIVKDRDRAIRACKYAIERPGVEFEDYARYVRLILAKEGGLSPEENTAVGGVLAHLEKEPSLNLATNLLRCEFGVKANDVPALETCTKVLIKLAPDDRKTIVFQWNLALQKGQRAEAQRHLARAEKAGVVADSLQHMQKVTGGQRRMWTGVGGVAALLGIAALVWGLRRRRLLLHRLAR